MAKNTKEIKAIPAFIKAIDDAGIVEHLVAVFGNIDEGNDVIHPGSFAKTIAERGAKIRCLDQHATDSIMRVIGKPIAMREVGRDELPPEVLARFPEATGGLLVKTQFLMNTPEGAGAFARIKAGAVDEYSIGYDALDADYSTATKDGGEITVRNLRTIKLWEYSPVIFAMNPATATLSAKDATPSAAAPVPSEGKPWNVFEEGGKWVVYKIDDEGDPIGEPVGTHDSEESARAQLAALYASETAGKVPASLGVTVKADYPWDECIADQMERYGDEETARRVCGAIRNMGMPFDKITDAERVKIENELGIKHAKAQKVGRVFAARNVNRMRQIAALLTELLAEIEEEETPDENEPMMGDEDMSKQAAQQAGPGKVPPTAPQDDAMLHLIEIEMLELQN